MVPRSDPVRVPISLPTDLYEWLRDAAFRRHVSMAEVVREAMREYRERREQQLALPLNGGER
ncbi:MAG TPA: ribbon-helix-helix protein, CopG family [Nitrospira sp.]|nr:ribbon-helix-helix protein, CopG family [Nitrospira sp.]